MDTFSKNLTLLSKTDPKLAHLIRYWTPSDNYIEFPSKSGTVTLQKKNESGQKKSIHSPYDPEKEAQRLIDSSGLKKQQVIVILGMGLGYHLLEIIRRFPNPVKLIIIEKDPDLFYRALKHHDFSPLIAHSNVHFWVGIEIGEIQSKLEQEQFNFSLYGVTPIPFKPCVNEEPEYYHLITINIQKLYQEASINQKTQTRFAKLFYHNFFDNLPSIVDSPGINNLKDRWLDQPVILVSAGPSLDKNISILKHFQNKALLISVATAYKPLMNNGIIPDIVFAIDPDETMYLAFDGMDLSSASTRLVFDPCIFSQIPLEYSGMRNSIDSNLYISQWLASFMGSKGSLGKMQSVAHTAYQFSRFLGSDPIILVGQDLAFNGYRMHCSKSYYEEPLPEKFTRWSTLETCFQEKFNTFKDSVFIARDLFGGEVSTTRAMDSYKNLFVEKTRSQLEFINATEGGFHLEGMKHLSLRETLIKKCREDLREFKKELMNAMGKTNQSIDPVPHFENQNQKLTDLIQRLKGLKSKVGHANGNICEIRKFIEEMDMFYRELLEDTATLKLLQGYAYSEFLDWNRSFIEFQEMANDTDDEELIKKRFERDSCFLDVLINSVEFIHQQILKAIQQLQNI